MKIFQLNNKYVEKYVDNLSNLSVTYNNNIAKLPYFINILNYVKNCIKNKTFSVKYLMLWLLFLYNTICSI